MRRLALALLALCATSAGAQPAPYRRWSTLDTPHFHVHASAGLEREGRVAAAAAERAYGLLAKEMVAPRGPIDLVVSDDADYSNGYATPYPGNRIVVFATPPVESPSLSLTEDWLQEVVTHELTHIFHLDRSRGIWAGAQRVFGRAVFLFPNIYSPSWLTEGLAVYYESRLTEGGRLRSAEHRTWARAAALEDRLPHLGDLSLGTPRFPGGQGAYGYGSLFIEYLANTYGDSAVPRFVERQSGALVPVLQDRAAKRAFGDALSDAFAAWRDSVTRSVRSAPALAASDTSAPQPGMSKLAPLALGASDVRDLSRHAWLAVSPRWLDDTTLVYVGGDGRTSNAAWTLTTSGVRMRIGRRASTGANVPMSGGRVLFADPQYVGTEEVRSDLYVQDASGTRRLTHGARLVQPDVSASGRIVAVELAAARSGLVLLDSVGGDRRVLRSPAPDETWSEPRWSPDGRALVAVHRLPGGEERLELIDAERGTGCSLAEGSFLLSSPTWSRDEAVLYVTERSGLPQVEESRGCGDGAVRVTNAAAGVAGIEANPRTGLLAVVMTRADGYHLGVIARSTPHPARPLERAVQGVDSALTRVQAQAAGAYRPYSPWPTLRPRWWLPIIEGGPGGGTRLGAMTEGNDVIGRHAYGAYAGVESDGRFATGTLAYRYAGLRRPFIDAAIWQDWTGEGDLRDQATGAMLGSLLKRTQDLSLAATFARPRTRTYSSLSAGLGVERRHFATAPEPFLAQLDPSFSRDYTYPRAFVSASFSNAQRPRLSISPEDGVSLAATVRERYRTDAAARTGSASVVAATSGYRSLDLGGFAHQVLALRVAGGWADAHAASSFEVGGTSGASFDVAPGVNVGEGRRTFGVRGFPAASVYGTSAVAASLEARSPLLLGGVGSWPVPAFFDRSSVSLFADAGSAGCVSAPLYVGICSPAGVIGRTIASVGAELGISAALVQRDAPELFRLGIAVPVAGRSVVEASGRTVQAASLYVAFGQAF